MGSFGVAQGLQGPTPLRLASKLASLAAPPLKGSGKYMKLGRLDHIGVAVQPKPLPFRRGGTSPPDWSERLHGVGVGYIGLRNADGPHPLPLP